jgi:hypothetical protein
MKAGIERAALPTRYVINTSKDIDKIEYEMSIKRPIADRINISFIKTYKPVIDDAPYRIFSSLPDYRLWCEKCLPKWLGYGK